MARKDSGKKAAKGGTGRDHKRPGSNTTRRAGAATRSSKGATKRAKRGSRDTKAEASEQAPWPNERQVLFKPERLKYVRKMIRPEGCVFCSAVEQGVKAESLLLYSSPHAIVVMNKFPYNPGHLLVLPKRHCGDFLQLTEEELAGTQKLVRHCLKVLTEVYQPAGFNVGLNLGSAAGAGIPEHMHYHIVPRWNGDTNFFPLIAQTKVVVETLEQTFDRLLPFFDEV